MHRSFMPALVVAVAASLVGGASCSREKVEEKTYRVGDKAKAGPLLYTASATEWREQVGEGAEARRAAGRFLVVSLTVTNSGIDTAAIPSTELVDRSGKIYSELTDVKGVPEWMGTVRLVQSAQTEHGAVVFDVPPGDYSLRVRHQAELDSAGVSALIDLPYQLPTPSD